MVRKYLNKRASEYAKQGIGRRVSMLRHCTHQTFDRIPPEMETEQTTVAIRDAEAFIQTFIINIFGVLDNFARVWCLEANIRAKNGGEVPDGHIGLGAKNKTVRKSMSEGMQNYLATANDWFSYLENYRHALAHRIPLYIVPKTLNDVQASEFRRLDTEILQAIKNHDYKKHAALISEQMMLGTFQPIIAHSLEESGTPILFHGQMLNDLSTVVDIGEHILDELNALTA